MLMIRCIKAFAATVSALALLKIHQVDALELQLTAASGSDCNLGNRPFDPLQHKRKYRVGVHAIRGADAAKAEYNQLFGEYLTATSGKRFNPPIEFEMVPVTFQGLFDAVEKEEIDFFYANPSIYSCVGVVSSANRLSLPTLRTPMPSQLSSLL